MKIVLAIMLFAPLITLGQNDYEIKFLTITATEAPDTPTPELSAFQKKVKNTIYKTSYFSDFTNQAVTAQNFWQPVDMAALGSEQRQSSRISMDRLRSSLGRTSIYGYTSDRKTRTRNQVYVDQQYYAPIFDPYRSFYRNRNYNPYLYPVNPRRTTIITIGGDNQ